MHSMQPKYLVNKMSKSSTVASLGAVCAEMWSIVADDVEAVAASGVRRPAHQLAQSKSDRQLGDFSVVCLQL